MTSDVVLTAALRNNLLSLQKTQSNIDATQLRLATGLKVNSALDSPQSFFASESLKNRASDLTRLLDGLGQNIQVIKAADAGITALTKLVEQADSVAQSARDALAAGTAEAKVTGNVDLRGIDDLTSINGIANGDTISLSITDEDGKALLLGGYGDTGLVAGTNETVDIAINTNDSIQELITKINNIQVSNGSGVATGGQAFEASLDTAGNLQIRTLNGGNFTASFEAAAGSTVSDNLAMAQALGFGNTAQAVARGDTTDPTDPAEYSVEFTAVADVALRSFGMIDASGADPVTASRSSLLSDLEDAEGTSLFNVAAGSEFVISINGGEEIAIDLVDANDESISIQKFIDDINNNDTLNGMVHADFDEATGQLSITPINAEVNSIEIGTNEATEANFGFGLADLQSSAGESARETIRLASAAGELASYQNEYNNLRQQITELVTNGDTGYRGTNLLNGDNLTSFFNESRSSSLITEGATFTADGLGIREANFSRASSVEGALNDIRSALESVRTFGSTLANNLSVIQTRQDFTQNMINTLQEGSDKLVVADQNEEGTKLLALQTRQQLGVTSLSLASQSQQSILRLF